MITEQVENYTHRRRGSGHLLWMNLSRTLKLKELLCEFHNMRHFDKDNCAGNTLWSERRSSLRCLSRKPMQRFNLKVSCKSSAISCHLKAIIYWDLLILANLRFFGKLHNYICCHWLLNNFTLQLVSKV